MAAHPDQPDYSVPSLGPISKESRWEWRSRIDNDGYVPPPGIFAYLEISEAWKGKFFPRGCRGKIDRFEVYCDGDGVDEITLAFSPAPGMGEVDTVTFAPVAGWAWQSVNWRRFWHYDSLFIWIKKCEANVTYAYDVGAPYDAHTSDATIAVWQRETRRYFIRVVYDAETPGDVPVSGTINNVEIPNITTAGKQVTLTAAAGIGNTDFVTVDGAGKLTWVAWNLDEDIDRDNLFPKVVTDGREVFPFSVLRFRDIQQFRINDGVCCPGIAWCMWDETRALYTLAAKIDFPFRRRVSVGIENRDAVAAHDAFVYYIVELIG